VRAARNRDIQMVLQDPMSSFNPRYTLRSSLAVPLRLKGGLPHDAFERRLRESVRRVGLPEIVLDRYPHQLSGGQLQRLSIARAISSEPKLLIADEPASKLDVSVRVQVLNLLKDLNRELSMAMLLITHDLDVARFLCDRVSVVKAGDFIEEGPTAQVFLDPVHDYTRSLMDHHRLQGA
jgi:oligopeptide transport system ATP-binding protein